MNSFEVVSRTKGPAIGHFPIGSDLQTMSLGILEVLVNARQNQMSRGGRRFEERGGRLRRFLVVVIVVKGREVYRQVFTHHGSIAKFIGDQTFVLDVGIAKNRDQSGCASGAWESGDIQADRSVGIRRRPNGMGDSSPNHVVFV